MSVPTLAASGAVSAPRPGLAGEECREIGLEKIAFDDADRSGHPALERRGQVAVDLHRHEPRDARRERGGERSAAGADLQERFVGARVDGGHQLGHPRRFEEVLAEALARPHSSSSSSGPSVSPRQ